MVYYKILNILIVPCAIQQDLVVAGFLVLIFGGVFWSHRSLTRDLTRAPCSGSTES